MPEGEQGPVEVSRNMNNFEKLVTMIASRDALIQEVEDDRLDLAFLFIKALRKSVREVSFGGANPLDFADLTVVNLIILGAEEGYSANEMREFIVQLKNDDDEDEFSGQYDFWYGEGFEESRRRESQ